MKKLCVALILLVLLVSFSHVYADEPKENEEKKNDENAIDVEKKVREILDNEAKEKIDVLVRRIKEIGESAVPYLIKEINSGEKVFVAVRALNEIRGVACIPDLFKAFVTRTKIVDGRFYLASTIRLHKKPALKFLFEKLNDEDEIVRMNAVELIAYCELLNSIDELKELYAKDKSNLVKLQIIREIFKVDDRSQKDYLEYTHEMLNNANEDVKIKAIDVTQWIKDETQIDLIITFLDDKSFEVRKSAIKGLLSLGNEKAINAVIKTIKHEDSETGKYTITWLSIQYIIADQKVKKRIIETFIDELANENIVIRLEIVKRLSTFRDSSIIPHLEKIAENDPEEEIRVEAKKSIERINRNIKANEDMKNFGNKDENKKDDEEGMDPIEKQVNEILSKYNIDLTDSDKIQKLVEIGEPAVQYLLPKLESKDQNQQYLAASALKEICGTKCLSHLVDAYLKQESQNFKLKKVITSFGVEAFNHLQARFTDENEMIRAEIVSLLISIDFRKAENVLRMQFNIEKSDRVKLYIAMYYQGSDKENKELYQQFIYEMLRGQDEDLKWLAINHVGRKRDFTAFAQLVVLTSDESSKVRIAALRAISQNHCEETVDAILKALKHEDEDTRMEAASCLSLYNFKDKELELKAIKALIEALNDEDHSVRNRVIRALSVHDDMIIVPALEKVAQDDTIKANREYAERAIKQIKLRNGIKDDIDDD